MKRIILAFYLLVIAHLAFSQEKLPNDNAAESKEKRNTLTFNPFHVFLGNIQFSYERILPSGKIGLLPFVSVPVVPLAVGLNRLYFNAGMDMRYYPTGQGRVKYYTSFSASIGYNENHYYNSNIFNLDYFSNLLFRTSYHAYGWFGKAMLHNGFVVYPTKDKGFNMGLNLGIGAIFTQAWWYTYDGLIWIWPLPKRDENIILPTLEFSFTIGFKY